MRYLTCLTVNLLLGSVVAQAALLVQPLQPALAKRHAENSEDPSVQNFKEGVALYEKKDYDGAIDALLQSTYFARNGYAPRSYYFLGLAYSEKHQSPKAIESLNKAIEQSLNGFPDAHMAIARILLRDDRLQEAETECTQALNEISGPGYECHYLFGQILEKKGDNSGASMHYLEALGRAPWTYTECWETYAELLMKMKAWGQAASQFGDMLTSEKLLKGLDHERIYLDLGQCLLAKGDHQGAIENWHRCLDWNKANPDAHLQLGMLFDAETHISSAIKEYKEFIRLSDDPRKIGRAKQRVEMLQQKLGPGENEPVKVSPSPYMRGQQPRGDGSPSSNVPQGPYSKESGF